MSETIEAPVSPVAEYSATNAALTVLRERYTDATYPVTTTKGMEAAKAARAELRGYRTALEKVRVEIKGPALERCRLIDAEAKRITAELVELEGPIDRQIKAEEERKAAEKAERERVELARVTLIHEHIADIKTIGTLQADRSSAQVQGLIDDLVGLALTEDRFQEFLPAAEREKESTLQRLEGMKAQAILREQAEAQAAADRAELARLRAEAEERDRAAKAESDRVAKAQAEELRKAREEAAAEIAQAKAEAQALRADADRRAAEAQDKAIREAVVEVLGLPVRAAAAEPVAAAAKPVNEWAELEFALESPPPMGDAPTADEVVEIIASTFVVSSETARAWLRSIQF